ncbi:trichothecene efflux pump [Fusarium acutatum]|uniref:Trichothecene efflux pump n=1 Tax=Fusarium acutatum TaxID=78861 RepID=A0A8H4JCS3_9HYPO|nr:trichothecene efflux pump [Fusarium acutatum]
MGFVFLTSIPFGVFGLVVARTMIENIHEGWRWSYYLGIILSVITLALYQFLYHPPTFSQLHVGKTRIQQTKELDWIGMSLFTTGYILFLVGLSWGDSIKVGWQSCVIGGGVVLGQAMSGLAIAYVLRLKIQCICVAALVMTFVTSMCSISPDSKGFPELLAWSNKYVIPAATRSGLPTKSLPSLFEAINKGDYSDVPGINKAIIDSARDAVVKAYTGSLHYVFYATIPFSCIMLVTACLVPNFKKFLTYNVAKRLQDKSFRKSSGEANEVTVQAMNECHPDEAKVASLV